MRALAFCGVAVMSAVLAATAVAQPLPARGGWDLARRESWLQERIDRGASDGSLTRMEARRVQRELRRIRMEEDRMRARNGGPLRPDQRIRLEARLNDLSDHIRWARRNDFARPW